ncbi:hypothetical protein KQI84_13365 [bacterium]|nr:hypothetical protein [bacterium]
MYSVARGPAHGLCAGLFACLLILLVSVIEAAPFTYQGFLKDGSAPANGSFDFTFTPFDGETLGTALATEVAVGDVNVVDGVFTVEIDFPNSIWEGDPPWLEVHVRATGSGGDYDTLSPRQQLMAAPLASMARDALALDGHAAADFADATHPHVKTDISDLEPITAVPAADSIPKAGTDGMLADGWIPPGNQIVHAFTAGDTISEGSPVGLLNGKLRSQTGQIQLISSSSIPAAADADLDAWDSEHAIYAYIDPVAEANAMVVVLTVEDGAVVCGTPKVISTGHAQGIRVAALSYRRFVVVFTDTDNLYRGTLIAGGASDPSSIEVGTPVTYSAEQGWTHEVFWLGGYMKYDFCVFLRDAGNSYHGTVSVGTMNPSTFGITLGSPVEVSSVPAAALSGMWLTNSRFLVSYGADSARQDVALLSLDRTNLTATVQATRTVSSDPPAATWVQRLSGDEALVAQRYNAATARSHLIQVRANEAGISIQDVETVNLKCWGLAVQPGGEFGMLWLSGMVPNLYFGKVLDSGIRLGYSTQIIITGCSYFSLVGLGAQDFLMSTAGTPDSYASLVGFPTPIGIAAESGEVDQPVSAIIQGVSDVHSGLVPGTVYYTTHYGSLTSDPSIWKVGTAISETELLLEIER